MLFAITGALDSGDISLASDGFGLRGQFENQPPAHEVVAQDEVEAIGKGIPKRTKKSQLMRMNNLSNRG